MCHSSGSELCISMSRTYTIICHHSSHVQCFEDESCRWIGIIYGFIISQVAAKCQRRAWVETRNHRRLQAALGCTQAFVMSTHEGGKGCDHPSKDVVVRAIS